MNKKFFIIVGVIAILIGVIGYIVTNKKQHTTEVADTEKQEEVYSDFDINGITIRLPCPAVEVSSDDSVAKFDDAVDGIPNFEGKEFAIPEYSVTYKVVVGYLNEIPTTSDSYSSLQNVFDSYKSFVIKDEVPIDDGMLYSCESEEFGELTLDYYILNTGVLILSTHPKDIGSFEIYGTEVERDMSAFTISGSAISDSALTVESVDARENKSGVDNEFGIDWVKTIYQVLKYNTTYDAAMYEVNGDVKVLKEGSIIHDTKDVLIKVGNFVKVKGGIAVNLTVTNNSDKSYPDLGDSEKKGYTVGLSPVLYYKGEMYDSKFNSGYRDIAVTTVGKGQTQTGYVVFDLPDDADSVKFVYRKFFESQENKKDDLIRVEGDFNISDLEPLIN